MTPEINPCDLQVRLDEYCSMVAQKNADYFKAMNFTFAESDAITVEYGRKYARIVKVDQSNGGRSVHTFVNMLNGDILKAGGWKAPQPNGVRGNIFADDLGADRVNEHGANYLRGPRF